MHTFFSSEDQLNVQVFKTDNKDNSSKLNYKFDIYQMSPKKEPTIISVVACAKSYLIRRSIYSLRL